MVRRRSKTGRVLCSSHQNNGPHFLTAAVFKAFRIETDIKKNKPCDRSCDGMDKATCTRANAAARYSSGNVHKKEPDRNRQQKCREIASMNPPVRFVPGKQFYRKAQQ